MSKVLFCVDCKHFSIKATCRRDSSRDLIYGVHQGPDYECTKERGYDPEYIKKSIAINHEICGFEAKFFEAKQ